jgi:hypothetical protein
VSSRYRFAHKRWHFISPLSDRAPGQGPSVTVAQVRDGLKAATPAGLMGRRGLPGQPLGTELESVPGWYRLQCTRFDRSSSSGIPRRVRSSSRSTRGRSGDREAHDPAIATLTERNYLRRRPQDTVGRLTPRPTLTIQITLAGVVSASLRSMQRLNLVRSQLRLTWTWGYLK